MFLWLIKTEISLNISSYLVVASDYILYYIYILYIFLSNITVAVMHGEGICISWLIFKLQNGLHMKNYENHWFNITVLNWKLGYFVASFPFSLLLKYVARRSCISFILLLYKFPSMNRRMNQSFHKPGWGTRKQTIKEKILPIPSCGRKHLLGKHTW